MEVPIEPRVVLSPAALENAYFVCHNVQVGWNYLMAVGNLTFTLFQDFMHYCGFKNKSLEQAKKTKKSK